MKRRSPRRFAEPSFTSRHATEFTGVDVELAWIDDFQDVMGFEERMLVHVLAAAADRHGLDLSIPATPFPRITMAEAQRMLRAQGWDGTAADLNPKASGVSPRKPAMSSCLSPATRPAPGPLPYCPADQPDLTLSYDLLWKGLEITTGAQREHRYDILLRQAAEKGLSPGPMTDYLNCFRYGCPPHGGFGPGLGRLLTTLLDLDSLREATFLFRGPTGSPPDTRALAAGWSRSHQGECQPRCPPVVDA